MKKSHKSSSAEQMATATMAAAPAADGRVRSGRRRIAAMRVEFPKTGGHIIHHEYDNSGMGVPYRESKQTVFGAGQESKARGHVMKMMGGSKEE